MALAGPDRILRDLGRRIAELRRERGMTQEQFAERWKVSAGYVRQVEAGANLTVVSLYTVARLLEVDIPDLFMAPRQRKVRRGRPPRADKTSA